MTIDKTEIWGFKHAIRGMRNPMNSWDKSDSPEDCTELGKNDLDLATKLVASGSSHRKFLRQIFVSADITAPLYWWKEFDTYKVATVSNSCSTMHKLASTPITSDCFETGNMDEYEKDVFEEYIKNLETIRLKFNATKDYNIWKSLIIMLPESWLQKRTVTMDYETIRNIVMQRKHHKLSEWSDIFIGWARSLPYSEQFLFDEK